MITENSLNDHRARSRNLITLILVLLLLSVSVCVAVGQDETAPKSPVDTAVSPASKSTDDARPSLDELMAIFAKHEAAYTPFHLQVRETLPAPAASNSKDLSVLLFDDEREREMVFQYAQKSSNDWMWQQSTIVAGVVENTIREVHTKDGTIRKPAENAAPGQEATHSTNLLNAPPLIGLFPLRMRSSSNPVLLSEYYKEDPSRLKLSWDGPLAKLTFEFAEPDDRPTQMELWLDPAYEWHPVKLQRFRGVPDQLFDEEWKVTEFRIAEKDVRVSAGTWRFSQVDWNDKNAVGTAEKVRTTNFVVTGSCYGDRVNPAVFSPESAIDTSRLQSSEPAEGTAVPVKNNTEDSSTPSQQVTVYYLRSAKAEQARQLIRELYPVEFEILVADARTNALFFRGSEPSRKTLEQLLEVLDSDSSLKSTAGNVNGGGSLFGGGGFGSGASPFGGGRSKPQTTEPNPPTPPNAGDRVVRFFHLKRIDPEGAIRMIKDLSKGKVEAESIVDSENNLHALVLRGDAAAVNQMEAVLRKVDEAGTKAIDEAQSFNGNEQSQSEPVDADRSVAEDTTALRREYERCEVLSREVARKLHELQEPAEDKNLLEKQVHEKAITDHRDALRDAVRQSFEARQKLHRVEMAKFARRLKNLQQTIDARDRIADKIVERRLEELQDPALNWEATESANESKSSENTVDNIDPAIAEKIEAGAWGEPVRGLRMAVVNLSDNAPSDKPLDIVCILENVSDQRIVLHDDGWSLSTECDIRTTSKAQVKTVPGGLNTGALSGDRDKVLDPGQRIVISKIQICITDDAEATEVPDSANLLIVDRESSRFRNAIYLLRCNLRAQFEGEDVPAIPLASGQIAIGFHSPENRENSPVDEPNAKDEILESSVSGAPPIPLLHKSVTENNRQPPTSDAEKAIARLVIVFFQDQARRAVPGLSIDRGDETFVLTTSPATIVPEGVPHAMDRAFLEFPGEADAAAEFVNTPTTDLCFLRAKPGLTKFQLEKPIALAVGDSLSAILLTGQPELRVTPNAARITALDQATTFALETHKFQHEYSGLVEIDQRLPEGTPLFRDGQLAGIVLLGSRFSGDDARRSLVVPAERIFEALGQIPASEQ